MCFGHTLRQRQPMPFADIPSGGPPRRLDSWKEIAEYLHRDIRTATRWESQGLPLHRIAGGKGRSVFAFTDEIDAWMTSHPAEPQADVILQPAPATAPEASPRLRTRTISLAGALVVIGVGALVMSSGSGPPVNRLRPEITGTASHVAITDASGVSRVIHQFAPGAVPDHSGRRVQLEDLDADGALEILTDVSHYIDRGGRMSGSGELLDLSTAGDVRWRFAFSDVMAFGEREVSGPWAITDWQTESNVPLKRIAVAAHEQQWWASLVTVLGHTGRPLGATFVNPGWIESVLWLSSDRLAIAGFNNLRKASMFAMLDTNHVNGQAPGTAGTEYACVTCSSTPPVFYATFARSELNLVAAAGFIRTGLSTVGDRLVVETIEFDRALGAATGIYEFDRDHRLLTARYSDSYWDEHVRLEREGRLLHSREKCPERDGPAAIHVWDATRGWVRTAPLRER